MHNTTSLVVSADPCERFHQYRGKNFCCVFEAFLGDGVVDTVSADTSELCCLLWSCLGPSFDLDTARIWLTTLNLWINRETNI